MVISTSAVNFGLLFETEQMSIIESFAGFLNSLSFPIQIVVQSRRLDVSSYLSTLDKALATQTNPLLKNMTARYREFVAGIIKEKNVLDKQFYVCLAVNPVELGVLPKNIADKSKRATTVLAPRRDHVIRQLSRLGLKSRQMTTPDLVTLFYNIYNPPYPENQFSLEDGKQKPEARKSDKSVDQVAGEDKKLINQPVEVAAPQTTAPLPQPAPTQPAFAPHPIPQTPIPSAPAPSSTTPLSPPFVVEELNDDFGP